MKKPKFLTKQQIVSKVKRHLKRQRRTAVVGLKCVYRNQHGLKCAVGCLIPDHLYSPEIEGLFVTDHLMSQQLMESGVDVSNEEIVETLLTLQEIHDKELGVFFGPVDVDCGFKKNGI